MFKGEERIITIPGFKIAAKEWGSENGPRVLALHGWLDNAASFDFLAPLLPELHIIALDSPGCGHSSHRSEGSIPSIMDEVFFVLQAANALGWDKFSIMGHSRGGIIGELVAAGAPERVQSLVLLDIFGMLTASREEIASYLRTSIKSYLNYPLKKATLYPDLEVATKGRMMASAMKFESALALTKRGTTPVEGGYKWTFDRRELSFATPIRFTQEMVYAFLAGIEAPTCIIIADEGIYKDSEDEIAERLHLVKNHVLHRVHGTHYVHMDDSPIVAKIIREFLIKS